MPIRPVSVLLVVGTSLSVASGAGEGGPPAGAARRVPAGHPPAFIYYPPLAHTGGFGEPTCHLCHNEFDLGFPGGSLELVGLPEGYEPGRRYPVQVVLHTQEMVVAGFQLSARFDDGRPAGRLAPVDARVQVTDSTGVPYARQAQGGADPESPELARWTLEWTAPPSGGAVRFHAAANSGNGDNSPFGDLIYATERVVRPRGS